MSRESHGRNFIGEMKELLFKQRREIQARQHEISIERFADPNEQSAVFSRNELSARQIERDRRQLRRVEDAIQRIGTGGYGVCERCQKLISERRLQVVPEAEFCIRCTEAIEAEERLESEMTLYAGDDQRDRGPVERRDRLQDPHIREW